MIRLWVWELLKMWVPCCPNCDEVKLTLAPRDKFESIFDVKADNIPLGCTHCMWRGIYRDIRWKQL